MCSDTDNQDHVVPVITYRYPPQPAGGEKKEKDGTMASIPQFCFPVIDKEPKSKMEKHVAASSSRMRRSFRAEKSFRLCSPSRTEQDGTAFLSLASERIPRPS